MSTLSELTQYQWGDAGGNNFTAHLRRRLGDHDAEAHQHDSLLYLFNAFVIGTGVMNISMYFDSVQQTVMLFVLGLLYSLFMEGLQLTDDVGVFGQSFLMWMDIDPHLLLFALLPALLAGDAMSIDTSVAKRVAFQCLYLAGPGVLMNAMIIAGFLCLYLGWSFMLSLVTGSILCATDPVAVVALLKELGASPVLTVQIQGESLLNDGTAMVLYMVSYAILSGENYDAADIVMFLVQKALMAWALGMFIGYFFFTWIRAASNKLKHDSGMIQISLTICCAYWSFIVAEGVFHISGVLSTVASSLVLAHHMWPHIVHPESLQHVWHMIENMGNIVIFFLAGSLTGNIMVRIEFINYIHLLVIYVVLVASRTFLIFMSRPLLRLLNTTKHPVTAPDALVMSWAGLRGAVGLCLAVTVHRDRAKNGDGEAQIDVHDAELVLFFVSGIALLTTVINAVTAPTLVKSLGITALPVAQKRLLRMLYQQMVNWSVKEHNPDKVTNSLRQMLREIDDQIDLQQSEAIEKKLSKNLSTRSNDDVVESLPSRENFSLHSRNILIARMLTDGLPAYQENKEIIEQHQEAEDAFTGFSQEELKLLGDLPEQSLLGKAADMRILILSLTVDEEMAKTVNKAFLRLVTHQYWSQMEQGDLRPDSQEAEVLMTSIQMALSPLRADLVDFEYIADHIRVYSRGNLEWWKVFPEGEEGTLQRQLEPEEPGPLMQFVQSTAFSVSIAVIIVANCLLVGVEEAARNEDNEYHPGWLLAELFFTTVFVAEFLLKFTALRCKYFRDFANDFDFSLVVLGVFGAIISVQVFIDGQGATQNLSTANIIRVSRVFRVLRFLRVFRLFHARLGIDKEVSLHVAEHIHKMSTLMSFVKAHLQSELDLVKYFGGNGEIDDSSEAELARCILQSQVMVYRALKMALEEERQLERQLLAELRWVHNRKAITEGLEKFVLSAYKDCAISAQEAESILEPLHLQLAKCLKEIKTFSEGRLTQSTDRSTMLRSTTANFLRSATANFLRNETRGQDGVQSDSPRGSAVRSKLRSVHWLINGKSGARSEPVTKSSMVSMSASDEHHGPDGHQEALSSSSSHSTREPSTPFMPQE